MILTKQQLEKAKALNFKLSYFNYVMMWDLVGTQFKGQVKLSKQRVGELELLLQAWQIICHVHLAMGNFLRKQPPKFNIETDLDLNLDFSDPFNYLNMASKNGNFKTNETAIAMAFASMLRIHTITVNKHLYIDNYENFYVYDPSKLNVISALSLKLAFNPREQIESSQRFSPHSIVRFMTRYKEYDKTKNALPQIYDFIKTNDFVFYQKDDQGVFFDCINEPTGYCFILKKINKAVGTPRFKVLSFKHNYYDVDHVNSFTDSSIQK